MAGKIDDEFLAFARQLGATDIACVGNADLPTDKGYYESRDLSLLRKRIEDAGLRWAVLGEPPANWSDKIKLGLPGRDEQIGNWCKNLRNMGAAGIPAVAYKFSLRSVIPVAEQAGVRMGLHPDDPPISPIGGVARIIRSHSAMKRLTEIVPSDSNGLTFCQGTISEMPENVIDAIRYFGSRAKIIFVHFRNVTGPVPRFSETFVDEGHVNMLEAMKAYKEVGFDGPMIDDHVPHVIGDSSGQHRSHAYVMGYMKALIDAVDAGS